MRGRDGQATLKQSVHIYFNPRAPCGGATIVSICVGVTSPISIHAPRAGARPAVAAVFNSFPVISIHAPRAGARPPTLKLWTPLSLFQSTRPVRGRDHCKCSRRKRQSISIHAPRAGARQTLTLNYYPAERFQSTRPVRGRDVVHITFQDFARSFQSTRPVRGRDADRTCAREQYYISIHAPRAGARQPVLSAVCATLTFQSTRPVRGRDRQAAYQIARTHDFNPRAPCGGATRVLPAD